MNNDTTLAAASTASPIVGIGASAGGLTALARFLSPVLQAADQMTVEPDTSTEEMQSMNEEWQSVNKTLPLKVAEVLRARNDMRNLRNSPEIAILFLDDSQAQASLQVLATGQDGSHGVP